MTDHTTQTISDVMDPARACAMQATLGLSPDIAYGSALPPFFHQLYFWDPQPPQALGRDGHPMLGGLIPDLGLPRRMWASGRLAFHQPLVAGIKAEKTTTIEAVTQKEGAQGPLAFVRLRHDIRQRHAITLTEWQDLVYRPEAQRDDTPPQPTAARIDEEHSESHRFDPTLLFRYSALTFNGHRIHYDRPYARRVEGYSDLVVHGPLLAQLLMLMAQGQLGRPIATFDYRATTPLFENETATFCWKSGDAWVRGVDGRVCMTARAS